MASPNAEKVALDVIKAVSNGKLANKQKITEANGYSKKSARAQKAVRTKTYQKTIRPVVDGIAEEIEKIKIELKSRDISEERYNDLVRSMDLLIKNYQLLTGGNTETIGVLPILGGITQNEDNKEG